MSPTAPNSTGIACRMKPMSVKFTQYDELCVPGTIGP